MLYPGTHAIFKGGSHAKSTFGSAARGWLLRCGDGWTTPQRTRNRSQHWGGGARVIERRGTCAERPAQQQIAVAAGITGVEFKLQLLGRTICAWRLAVIVWRSC